MRDNRAWLWVLPVLLVVAFSAVIPLMTVVNYSVQDTARRAPKRISEARAGVAQ